MRTPYAKPIRAICVIAKTTFPILSSYWKRWKAPIILLIQQHGEYTPPLSWEIHGEIDNEQVQDDSTTK